MKNFLRIAIAVMIVLTMAGCGEATREAAIDEKNVYFETLSEEKTHGTKRIVTLRHIETGCHYITIYSYTNSAGVGGVTPLLTEDGKPYCK